MKWGIRRYQNSDGTYTSAGQKRNFKIVKKYAKKTEYRMGNAIGREHMHTSAADKVRALQGLRETAYRERARLLEKRGREFDTEMRKPSTKKETTEQKTNRIRSAVHKKYQSELNELDKRAAKLDKDFKDAVKKTVDDYLGKYGNVQIKTYSGAKISAGESFATDIEWGNATRAFRGL